MNKTRQKILSLGLLVALPAATQGAEITWGAAFSIAAPEDISNPPGSTVVGALDFSTGLGPADDLTINGILFTTSPAAGTGDITTTMANGPGYNATWFTGATGDNDLDALLDSHAWVAGSPGEVTITISNLVPARTYQIQVIGVADARGCCATRTYEPDDGMGNYTTGISMARGDFGSSLGTFTADASEQVFLWRSLGGAGNNDPGFSGLVVIELLDDEDDDGDGLTNGFEELHGLDPDDDDSDGDTILDGDENEDGDNLTNLQEQTAGTDPNDDDTDDDTLLDHVETNTGIWNGVDDTGTNPLKGDTDEDNLSDGVENPDLPFLDENQTGSDPNKGDTDTDTLPDDVEVALNLNPNDDDTDGNGTLDGDEDSDSDNSTNSNELALGTDPADDDSDDDTLLDGDETNTGTWVDENDTGTDPLNGDTDGDDLSDGVENPDLPFVDANQTGTDPNEKDSDGDLADDGLEIEEGTDPTNPNSTPAIPLISVIPGLLGGDLTDPEDDGVEGDTIPAAGDTPQTAGTGFNWIGITANAEEYFSGFGGGEGSFDLFDNQIGPGAAKLCCGGAPVDITVQFEEAVSLTHFTLTSSNDTPARDPLDFEIQGSNDGVTFTPIYSRADDISLWDARDQTVQIALPQASDSFTFIRYAVTRTGGTAHALSEIEYFGEVGPGTPLTITDISYDTETNRFTLVWTSKPGRTYTVFTNTNLGTFDADVNDSVLSGGDTTTFEFANPAPGAPRQFFQVVEN